MGIKVEGILNRDMFSSLGPFLHPELYKEWLPGITQSSLVIDLSRFRKVVYLRTMKFPFITTRDVVVLGYGDIISEDSVMIYLVSVDQEGPWSPEEDANQQAAAQAARTAPKPPPRPSASPPATAPAAAAPPAPPPVMSEAAMQATSESAAEAARCAPRGPSGLLFGHPPWLEGAPSSLNYREHTGAVDEDQRRGRTIRLKVAGGFLFKALSPTDTKLSAFVQFDLGMPFLPNGLVDFAMKQLAGQLVHKLDQQAARFEPDQPLHHYRTDPEHLDTYSELSRRLGKLGAHADPIDA